MGRDGVLLGRPARRSRGARVARLRPHRPRAAGLAPRGSPRGRPRAGDDAQRRGAQGGRGAMRAALLYGPGDLRVQEVPDPEGEVVVHVDAATTCGTDVKMFHRGHPVLPAYPCPFGHETAGTREDTGERVLVSDSVACGRCGPCRAGRPQICRAPRWVLGAFAERIAAPAAALHGIPEDLEPAGAAMAEPLAAAVHAGARGGEAGGGGVARGGARGPLLPRCVLG